MYYLVRLGCVIFLSVSLTVPELSFCSVKLACTSMGSRMYVLEEPHLGMGKRVRPCEFCPVFFSECFFADWLVKIRQSQGEDSALLAVLHPPLEKPGP